MSKRRSVLQTLRSRKLALWLLVGLAAWSALGTAGFEGAFSSPVFIAAIGLLAVSTVLCAWERTRLSAGELRRRGVVTDTLRRRLESRPLSVFAVPDGATALEAASGAMAGLRMRVRSGPRLAEAVGGRWGLLGSPVFHWALAGLIVVVALGQLTRAEGLMGVPVGSGRVDAPESYGFLEEGPLYRGHSGLVIAVDDFIVDFATGDQDRGPAPVVSLIDEGEVVAEQRVYANRPLRYGSLLVHMIDYGYAASVTARSVDGADVLDQEILVDFDESEPGGLEPAVFTITGPDLPGGRADIRLVLLLPDDDSGTGSARFDILEGGLAEESLPAEVGRPVALPGGATLELASVDYYARLSVADDWSVPLVYALLVIASIGISIAVLSPYRKAWVLLVEDGEGARLHIRARHWRGSPTFADDVIDAVRAATGQSAESRTPGDGDRGSFSGTGDSPVAESPEQEVRDDG